MLLPSMVWACTLLCRPISVPWVRLPTTEESVLGYCRRLTPAVLTTVPNGCDGRDIMTSKGTPERWDAVRHVDGLLAR